MVVFPEPVGPVTDQPVRGVHGLLDLQERFGVQAEFVEAGGEIGFVEHAEHAFLAVDSGEKGDAQIEILAADFDAHASVLGQAALGDVQAAHDFEAGGEGVLHLFGRRGDIEEMPSTR